MHALAALVAAGLLGAVALPGGTGDARVDAGSITYDVATGAYRLEGGVVISRGAVRLRAGAARYDLRTGEVEASGGVLLTDATRAISAERIHAVLDGPFEAHRVVTFLKAGPTDLTAAATPEAAAACGRNAVTARADTVSGVPNGALQLTEARVTPCDCAAGAPSWELRAGAAVVHPGETVELTWPVLWITPRFLFMERPVPVFTLPWISLPIAERVSGLLAPHIGIGSHSVTGSNLSQPVFITLGRSADLTVTPRYDFGRASGDVEAGKPSVRGPGASVEGRWVPDQGSAVRLQADALWDLDDDVGPLHGLPGASGLRLALTGALTQRYSATTSLRADLDLVGDALYVRDFTSDVLLRDGTVRRSAVQVARRGEDTLLELSAAWLEPVASSGALAAWVETDPTTGAITVTPVKGGLFGYALPAFHRWPSLEARLLPVALAGPLQLSARAGLARFAPLIGVTSDGGYDGIGPGERGLLPQYQPPRDAGEYDGRWQPGERLAATRLDARVELATPFTLGGVVAVTPALRGAALGYVFDAAKDPLANAWGSAGVTASTGLSRRYGAVRHDLEPRLEWRFTTGVAGPSLPAFGYDGWDRGGPVPPDAAATFAGPRRASAAPPGASSQARLSLATRLSRADEELLRAEIGQEVDLRTGGLAEAYLTASAARGPISGEADIRLWAGGGRPVPIDPELRPLKASWLDAFSEARLRLALADGRGDLIQAGLLAVGAGGSGRLGAGVDDLFDPRPNAAQALASATLAARLRLGAATLGYDVLLPARTSVVGACVGGGTRLANAWEIQQQSGFVEWNSPCHCFRVVAMGRVNACGELGGSVAIDLGAAAGVSGR